MQSGAATIPSSQQLYQLLMEHQYIPDDRTVSALVNLWKYNENVILEGPPGSGKTQFAKVFSKILGRKLIKIECTEETRREDLFRMDVQADSLYAAFESTEPCVCLIDEADKLQPKIALELLRPLDERETTLFDGTTRKAKSTVYVILTSNRQVKFAPEFLDRCVYCKLSLPTPKKELEALQVAYPYAPLGLLQDIVACTGWMRLEQYAIPPSIRAAKKMTVRGLDMKAQRLTAELLGICRTLLTKDPDDDDRLTGKWESLVNFLQKDGYQKVLTEGFGNRVYQHA
ncbi:MAG TPA: AAA family ATPase [Acidobacteriota bacterium]|nr:AAA family ATPase [Acidobacteriota bacterium]